MEPLHLLQFWHIPSDKTTTATGFSDTDITSSPSETTTTTTTTNDIDHHSVVTDDDDDSFFDLDFTVPSKKKLKDYNLPKPRSPRPKLRLHMLLKSPEESEKKTEASREFPIFSLLDLGNSTPSGKFQKQRSEKASSTTRARRFPRVVIQKYLKLINPFYPRGSRKACNQTVRSTTNKVSKRTTPFSSPRKQVVEKQGIFLAREHLGKSRSASAGLRPVPARRDDSLLLQHDGIQSAILHCKRSYNSSAGTEFCVLSRSASGPGAWDKASVIPRRSSTEEVKTRTSI